MLIERLDAARRRWNVLEHPFYRRWESGELTARELGAYAGEYRHAVVALADAADTAAPLAGAEHAEEEREHVDLWDDFARAVAADAAPARLDGTASCVAAWTSAADPLEALGILYAVEAGQPAVSETKLDGLVTHYGFEAGGLGTAYFSLHAERDHDHAAEARELLVQHAGPEDEDRVVAAAERALRGNWELLDGVDELRPG
jgi:pyrroloquinoline-quinone synthase